MRFYTLDDFFIRQKKYITDNLMKPVRGVTENTSTSVIKNYVYYDKPVKIT